MSRVLRSPLADDIDRFLAFKRALGHPYVRPEKTLRSFDRYVRRHAPRRGPLPLDRLLRGWLARIEGRRAITVATDLGPVRQFFLFRRREDPRGFVPDRTWAPQSTESHFLPCILAPADVRRVLRLARELPGRRIRRRTFATLVLLLYCTGLRLGEAVRLRLDDVDLRERLVHVRESKGKTRLVPFRSDLARELARYRRARTPAGTAFFVREDGSPWTVKVVSHTLRMLLRRAGLKPPRGRQGPRPFDFRHAFAVRRLTLWYRAGVDLHARLPLLSAYLGHDDLMGTEAYLHATPELLAVAGRRFRARLDGARCAP
jgi:site-specific recombinase XerD